MRFPKQRTLIIIVLVLLMIAASLGVFIAAYLISLPGGVFSADWEMTTWFPLVGENVTFEVTLEGGEPRSYSWDFGDGNTSSEASPSHTFNRSGKYWIELVVDWGYDTKISRGSLVQVQNRDVHEVLTGSRLTNPSRGMAYDLIYFEIYDGITRPNVTGRWTGSAICRELDIFIMTNPTDLGPRLVSEDLGRWYGGFDVTRSVDLSEDGAVDCEYIMVLEVIGGTITDYQLELTVEY